MFMGVGVSRVPRSGDDYADDPEVGLVAAETADPFADQPSPYDDPAGWRAWAMARPLQWKLDTLHPRLRQQVETILTGLHAAGFTDATVNYGWRHPAIQASLMRDGYTKTPWSLHSAVRYDDDLQAWVASGHAADIYWPRATSDADRARFYRHLQAMAVSLGLISGANWTGNGPAKAKARWAAYGLGYDPPHVELAITADEKDQIREDILTGILHLAEAREPVWAVPDTGVVDAYPVSWFKRAETIQQVTQAIQAEAVQTAKQVGSSGIGMLAAGAVVLALIALSGRKS